MQHHFDASCVLAKTSNHCVPWNAPKLKLNLAETDSLRGFHSSPQIILCRCDFVLEMLECYKEPTSDITLWHCINVKLHLQGKKKTEFIMCLSVKCSGQETATFCVPLPTSIEPVLRKPIEIVLCKPRVPQDPVVNSKKSRQISERTSIMTNLRQDRTSELGI